MNILQLQQESRALQSERFPLSTPRSTFAHLQEEWEREFVPLWRLLDALILSGGDVGRVALLANDLAVEGSDLIILLAQLCNTLGVDLDLALANKWATVKRRKYAQGADGVYRHVREGGD